MDSVARRVGAASPEAHEEAAPGAGAQRRFAALWARSRATLDTIERSPIRAARVIWGGWGATRLLLLLGLLIGRSYCDPWFYYYAGQLASGKLPYRDVHVEYPPMAMLLIVLPALALLPFPGIAPRPDAGFPTLAARASLTHLPHPLDGLRYGAYGVSFAIEMLAIDALTLWLVRRAGRRLAPGDPLGLRSALLYITLIFINGALLQKFDLATGLLCLAAVVALVEERDALSGVALALATLIKGFPVLALPALVAYHIAQSRRVRLRAALLARARPLLTAGAACGVTLLAGTLLALLASSWQALLASVLYHTSRGTEIESIYANALLALGWLPGLAASTRFNGADLSREVVSPLAGSLPWLSVALLGLLMVALYVALWRAITRAHGTRRMPWADGQIALIGVAGALLAFMLSFRALPAHYLLAVIPLAAVIRLPTARSQRLWVAALCGAALLGQGLTAVWNHLVALEPWAVAILSLRNCAWILALYLAFVALWQWPRPATRIARPSS